MNEVYITTQKLNNTDTIFFVGDTPTVTFNNNVTVYIYPRIENSIIRDDISDTNEIIDKDNDKDNRYCNKIFAFFAKCFKK